MKKVLYLVAGLLFGMGLNIAGMSNPEKIKIFLNVMNPNWSPALMVVLGSAVMIYGLCYSLLKKRMKTFDGRSYSAVVNKNIDSKLVIGSIIFGIGWGLIGLCPGPALVNLPTLDTKLIAFLIFMFLGFVIQKKRFA